MCMPAGFASEAMTNDPTDLSAARTVTVHVERLPGHPFTDGMTCDWCGETDHPEELALWMGKQCIGVYCTDCREMAIAMLALAAEEARQ